MTNTILSAVLNGFVVTLPLVFAVWMVLRVSFRRINAATRYCVYWIMLGAVVSVPMMYLPLRPIASIRIEPIRIEPAIRSSVRSQVPVIASPPPITEEHPIAPVFRPGILQSKHWLPVTLSPGAWPARFIEVWALASLLMCLRLVVSFIMLQRRKKRATEASDRLATLVERSQAQLGSRRRVCVGVVDDAVSPMVAGPFRPTILLPAPLLVAMQDAEIEQICLHEAAHLSRYDDWALLAQRLIEALFVLHPLALWISRQIHLEREIACDDLVISVTGHALPYAACLTHAAELAAGFTTSPLAAAAMDERSQLTRRVDMLLNGTRHTGVRLLRMRFVVLAASVVLLAFASAKTPGLLELRAAQEPLAIQLTQSSANAPRRTPLLISQIQPQPVAGGPSSVANVVSDSSVASKYFDQALQSLKDGAATDAAASAEKGWAALIATGPTAAGFIPDVYNAAGIFAGLRRELRAGALYTEAEALCAAPGLQLVKLRLQYMHADYLIRRSEYVKAEGILRASLEMENRTAQKSSLYVALLQNLAFVREQQGDLEGAEAFYRMTIGYPSPDLSGVVVQTFRIVTGASTPPLPFVGEPHLSMAAFYGNHGRFKEAESLYREVLAPPSLKVEERIDVMRQLVGFLRVHGSITESMAMQQQIIELRNAQPLTTPELRDRLANARYTLANLEVDAGRGDDAKSLLGSDLRQAEVLHGKNSPEYGEALNYLFENRSYAKDYESAEKLAREEIERAEAPNASERVGLASAIFRLADTLRAQGRVEESVALRARGIAVNRAGFPQPVSADRFADAEALVRAGKPGEAVQMAREIAESPATKEDDSFPFGFRHLAQSMAILYKVEAGQVASIALSAEESRLPDHPRYAFDLTDWAGFYRGALGQPERARDLLTRAEAIVRTCCGASSPQMEPVLQERAWLAAAMAGEAAGIPYLEQLRSLRIAIYGVQSRQVEQSDHDLVEANRRASR